MLRSLIFAAALLAPAPAFAQEEQPVDAYVQSNANAGARPVAAILGGACAN